MAHQKSKANQAHDAALDAATEKQAETRVETQRVKPARAEPSVQMDLHGFLTELREWTAAVEAGEWDTASERLRDACDEAYCLEGWKEFTSRLGTSNMQDFVPHLKRFLVAVETTARAIHTRTQDSDASTPSDDKSSPA